MERKTKIKHSHSTTRRYWATRGRESSCNILLCHLCSTDLYGLFLSSHRLITESWSCDVIPEHWDELLLSLCPWCDPEPTPAQWWIPPAFVSSCDTSSYPDPQWATFNQRSGSDPLFNSVWRALEKLCCAQRHKNGETCPPPAMLSLFDGIGMSQPLINSEFSWFPALPSLFLYDMQTAECCVVSTR